MVAAIKLAMVPKITSSTPKKATELATKHPAVTPTITGQPNSAANGIMQSARRNCIGPWPATPKTMTKTAYKLVKTIVKAISLVFILFFNLPTPGFLMRNGWEVPPTRNCNKSHRLLKNF